MAGENGNEESKAFGKLEVTLQGEQIFLAPAMGAQTLMARDFLRASSHWNFGTIFASPTSTEYNIASSWMINFSTRLEP